MHDEFCPNKDEVEDCNICRVIKMVRRDEQDKFSGDEEMDRELVEQEAYSKGFLEGQKSVKPAAATTSEMPLDKINKYILNGIGTRNLSQTQALYDLYMYLGGK
jgi:hypothetical protein